MKNCVINKVLIMYILQYTLFGESRQKQRLSVSKNNENSNQL